MRAEAFRETFLFVNDLEVAERFYTSVMGLTAVHRVRREYSRLSYDDNTLALFQTPASKDESGAAIVGHVSFSILSSDVASWRERLVTHNVTVDEEVTWPNGARSFCFRDPAGNSITLTTQGQDLQNVVNEEQTETVAPEGFHAKWKIYHAASAAAQKISAGDG